MPHSPRECEPQPVRAAAPSPQSPSPKRPGSPGARPHRPPASRRVVREGHPARAVSRGAAPPRPTQVAGRETDPPGS